MKRFALRSAFASVFFCALLALLATGGLTAVAQDATPEAPSVLPPDASVGGQNLAQWHAQFWQWTFSLPSSVDPLTDDNGERCVFGQHGPVFFLTISSTDVERTCTVPDGATLFVPVMVVECSNVEKDPFYGANEADLTTCANAHIDVGLAEDLAKVSLTIDGQAVGDLMPYRTATPLIQVGRPFDPETGEAGGVALSVGAGFAVMVGPLSDGEHTVEIVTRDGVHITYHLTVSSGEATPTAGTPVG
jgi:hypothetical protein